MKTTERTALPAGGYTLMEMMLVLAIIAVLLGTGAYVMRGVGEQGDRFRAEADVQTLSASLIRYKTAGRRYPTEAQGLRALYEQPADGPQPYSWTSLIEERLLIDPWDNPYQYRNPARRSSEAYDVFSLGPDRQEGTDDDIGNWDK